jgi:copper oxidase (laccase) domain-containing protein
MGQGHVAAVHAGWRGIVAGVIFRTVEQLCRLGSKPNQLLAAIGPHIRTAAFEVSEQVAQEIAAVSGDPRVISREHGPRPHIALAQSVRAQLTRSGVLLAHVDDVGGCTLNDESRFFSYRRQGAASGRLLHAIVAKH